MTTVIEASSPYPLIELNNVGLTYTDTCILEDINLTIHAADFLTIIGPNGAGKSSLIKIILGITAPSQGQVIRHYFLHKQIRIGYVPQKLNLSTLLPMQVADFFRLSNHAVSRWLQIRRPSFFGFGRSVRLSAKDEMLSTILEDKLTITKLLDKPMQGLSGGELQRVLLANALASQPNVLVLDEPMQGLDLETEQLLHEFISNLPEPLQCAVVMVSHDLHWVMQNSTHIICLNRHICCQGQPSDLHGSDAFTQMFGHHVMPQMAVPYQHRHHYCQHSAKSDLEDM